MKSAEHRDEMVARVQEGFKQYPDLKSLPVGAKPASDESEVITQRIDPMMGDAAYVSALNELSYRGAIVIGRTEDGEIIGEVIGEHCATLFNVGAKRITAHEVLKSPKT